MDVLLLQPSPCFITNALLLTSIETAVHSILSVLADSTLACYNRHGRTVSLWLSSIASHSSLHASFFKPRRQGGGVDGRYLYELTAHLHHLKPSGAAEYRYPSPSPSHEGKSDDERVWVEPRLQSKIVPFD